MFSQVIQIVAENGYLGPRELIYLQKQIGPEGLILGWKRSTESYQKNLSRALENEQYGSEVVFPKNTDLCSKTRASKEFKINEDDLSVLDYQLIYVRKARGWFRFYKTKDVIAVSYHKHGDPALRTMRKARQQKVDRKQDLHEQRVRYIHDFLSSQKEATPECIPIICQKDAVCRSFVSNGLQKRALQQHLRDVLRELRDLDSDQNVSRQKSLGELVTLSLRTPEEKQRDLRKNYLIEALARRNLAFRNDSSICEQYIEGLRDDIDEVVDIMEEMKWFFENTRYPQYIHYNILEDEMPRHQASVQAKKRALSNYRSQHRGDISQVPRRIMELYA